MDTNDGIIVDESPPAPEPPPAAPVVEEVPADAAPETPEPPVESAPTPSAPDPVQRRIDQVIARQRQAENEAAYWRGQAEARAVQPAAPTVPPGPPKEEDYASHTDYVAALVDYRVDQKLAARQDTDGVQRMRQHDDADRDERVAAWRAREQAVLATTPDYFAQVEALAPRVSSEVTWAVQHLGGDAPDVLLYLAAHPDALARVNQMPAHRVGIEFGRILKQLASAPATAAPADPLPARPKPEPPTPLAGGGRTVTPETFHENMPQAAYEAWRRKTSALFRRPGT